MPPHGAALADPLPRRWPGVSRCAVGGRHINEVPSIGLLGIRHHERRRRSFCCGFLGRQKSPSPSLASVGGRVRLISKATRFPRRSPSKTVFATDGGAVEVSRSPWAASSWKARKQGTGGITQSWYRRVFFVLRTGNKEFSESASLPARCGRKGASYPFVPKVFQETFVRAEVVRDLIRFSRHVQLPPCGTHGSSCSSSRRSSVGNEFMSGHGECLEEIWTLSKCPNGDLP